MISQNEPSIEQNVKTVSKRNPFQADEDAKLLQLVTLYGDQNWMKIASQMPGRSVRQCRERYKNNLSSDVKNNKWSKEEEELLKQKFYEFGPRWKYFEEFFPGRTSYNIRNKWNCIVRKWKNYSFINTNDVMSQNKFNNINCPQMKEPPSKTTSLFNEKASYSFEVDSFDFQDMLAFELQDETEFFDDILFENSAAV